MPGLPLNCLESSNFEQAKQGLLKSLVLSEKEFDEAYLSPMQMLVVYNPSIYPAISGTELHVFATDPTPKYPSVYIAYTFDDEKITLQHLELKLEDDE